MNGIVILEQPCPRCAIRRTVRRSGTSFCFNCHLQWGPESDYVFTAAELARLRIYRAAVHAGFYTDLVSVRRST